MDHLETARKLEAQRGPIVARAVALLMQDPFLNERFPNSSPERYTLDLERNFDSIVKAVRYRSPMIADDHIVWRRKMLLGLRCSTGLVRQGYAHLWTAVNEQLPDYMLPVVQDYFVSALRALVYPHVPAQQLAAAHEQLAEDLVAATYDVHWHWQAAYQIDGRARLLYDAWLCIDFLVDAMGTANPELLGTHMRWVRDISLRRGLSTTHMQQWLWLLSEAATQRLPPTAVDETRRTLERAVSFLVRDEEACRALMSWQDTVVAEVAGQVVAQGLAAQPESAAVEVGWYLAYLNDGLSLNDAAGLVCYVQWMQHWFAAQGLPDTPLRFCLNALDRSIVRHVPQYAAQAAQALIRTAQAAL